MTRSHWTANFGLQGVCTPQHQAKRAPLHIVCPFFHMQPSYLIFAACSPIHTTQSIFHLYLSGRYGVYYHSKRTHHVSPLSHSVRVPVTQAPSPRETVSSHAAFKLKPTRQILGVPCRDCGRPEAALL